MDYIWTGEWGQKVLAILEQKTSINSETGCWEWLGGKREGYGRVCIDHVTYSIPRLSAMLFLGYSPEFTHLWVLHKCNNRACWNHEHLYIGTATNNNQDTVEAGNHYSPGTDKTHCPHGHEYSKENTYIYEDTRGNVMRHCRTCRNIRVAKFKEKKKLREVG